MHSENCENCEHNRLRGVSTKLKSYLSIYFSHYWGIQGYAHNSHNSQNWWLIC
jgi:hypothetical protein